SSGERSLVMSSPANDDGDRRANRMPAWARDEPSFDTGRRLQDEIAAEVQRLNPARVAPLPDAHFQPRHEDSGAAGRKAGSPARPYHPEDPRRTPRRMQPNGPTPVQPPPRVEASGSRWGLTARLAGAAVLAIVVTVFVMRSPWFASGDRSVPLDTKDTGKEA